MNGIGGGGGGGGGMIIGDVNADIENFKLNGTLFT